MPQISDGQFWALFALLLVNLIGVAFVYGKLSQTVADNCRRIKRLEDIIDGRNDHGK